MMLRGGWAGIEQGLGGAVSCLAKKMSVRSRLILCYYSNASNSLVVAMQVYLVDDPSSLHESKRLLHQLAGDVEKPSQTAARASA